MRTILIVLIYIIIGANIGKAVANDDLLYTILYSVIGFLILLTLDKGEKND